ncbi:hypothetical protein ACMATS_37970 (plasmid) [Streptoverticillium reticulum]|uniref:hypothetical protein n=1 Tax=Streptoverticillium reticulum TaxID=1433415 RepID=UPI0039BFFCDB
MATVHNHIGPGARISGPVIQGTDFTEITFVQGRRVTAAPAPANPAAGAVRAPDGTVVLPERNALTVADLLRDLAALDPAKAEQATAYAKAMTGTQN